MEQLLHRDNTLRAWAIIRPPQNPSPHAPPAALPDRLHRRFLFLGAEVIALRRLVPHVGSAIVVTAPTIGLFLLALALGLPRGPG
jgi:hypothetical protein